MGAFDGLKIPPVNYPERLISNINSLLTWFRQNQKPIIFIQDCGEVGGAFEKGTPQWQIHNEIQPRDDEKVILKFSSNAFRDTNLREACLELSIETLVLCGLHSEHCFSTTALASQKLGFKTISVKDGHGTSQKSNEIADEVLSYQNDLLKGQGIEVITTQDILKLAVL